MTRELAGVTVSIWTILTLSERWLTTHTSLFDRAATEYDGARAKAAKTKRRGRGVAVADGNQRRADAELMGDDLVGMSGNEPIEHLPLALRERGKP